MISNFKLHESKGMHEGPSLLSSNCRFEPNATRASSRTHSDLTHTLKKLQAASCSYHATVLARQGQVALARYASQSNAVRESMYTPPHKQSLLSTRTQSRKVRNVTKAQPGNAALICRLGRMRRVRLAMAAVVSPAFLLGPQNIAHARAHRVGRGQWKVCG